MAALRTIHCTYVRLGCPAEILHPFCASTSLSMRPWITWRKRVRRHIGCGHITCNTASLSPTVPHLSLPVLTQRQSAVSSGTISAKLDMYLGFLYPIEEYRVCVLRRSIFLAHAQALICAGLAANAPTVPLRPCGHAPADMATATRLVPRPPSFRAGTAM